MSYQFNRQISVIVTDASGNGLELSGSYAVGQDTGSPVPFQPGFHIIFQVNHYSTETPNSLTLRIYNLADATAQQIRDEFTQIVLRAGYPGNFGIIFKGVIKRADKTSQAGAVDNVSSVRQGNDSPADTYLDIYAADGDQPYNWGVTNQSLAAGYTPQEVATAVAKAMGEQVPQSSVGGQAGQQPNPGQSASTSDSNLDSALNNAQNSFTALPLPNSVPNRGAPRGRVLYGMARHHARVLAKTQGLDWTINGGVMEWLPYSAYKPGDAIVLTSQTGLIGFPQQTQDGLAVRVLLNPSIGPGQRIQINNKSLQAPAFNNAFNAVNVTASTSADGFYKVIYADHTGDTRGQPWYTDLICLTTDATQDGASGAGLASGAILGVPIPP